MDPSAAFLTDRLGLFAVDVAGGLSWTAIRHAPWPLQPAEAEIERDTMAAAHGIGPARPRRRCSISQSGSMSSGVVAAADPDLAGTMDDTYGQATASSSSGWIGRRLIA